MIVEPGSLASSRAAIRAVSVDGDTASSPLVDQEAAIGVAVEGEADVGLLLEHPLLQVDQVGRLDRVGLVVGEGAVELEVHRHDLDQLVAEPLEDGRRGQAGHAVAGVDDDLQPATGHRREGQQVCGVRLEDVLLADAADLLRARWPPRMTDGAAMSARPVSVPIGVAPARHIFMPLYSRRVVAGGEHHARVAEVTGGEVELVGRGQADHDHVGAGLGRAGSEGARPGPGELGRMS